jgi:hypothetical protein
MSEPASGSSDKPDKSHLVYFSAADGQTEAFLEPGAFLKSLIFNALFQPGLLLPDIFLFISRGVERHPRWLEACIERGIVVPAFRAASGGSFMGAYASMHDIVGVLESAPKLAAEMQKAADRNPHFAPYLWQPQGVGEGLDRLIQDRLQRTLPPNIQCSDKDNLDLLWRQTKVWRIDCINEARRETERRQGGGIRRGEIIAAVGRQLGVTDRDHVVEDLRSLLESGLRPEVRRALVIFLQWLSDLYQLNGARSLGVRPSVPDYTLYREAMLTGDLPLSLPIASPPIVQAIEMWVRFPRVEILQTIPPHELLDIRDNEGQAYFAAVRAWRQHPTLQRDAVVRATLERYGAAIIKCARRYQDFLAVYLYAFLGHRSHAFSASFLKSVILSAGDMQEVRDGAAGAGCDRG